MKKFKGENYYFQNIHEKKIAKEWGFSDSTIKNCGNHINLRDAYKKQAEEEEEITDILNELN